MGFVGCVWAGGIWHVHPYPGSKTGVVPAGQVGGWDGFVPCGLAEFAAWVVPVAGMLDGEEPYWFDAVSTHS